MTTHTPDLVDYLYEQAFELAQECGAEQRRAHQSAQEFCRRVQHRFGGERHYVRAPDAGTRDAEILRAADAGVSQKAIAERFGVHPNTVANVIRRSKGTARADSGGFGREEWNL